MSSISKEIIAWDHPVSQFCYDFAIIVHITLPYHYMTLCPCKNNSLERDDGEEVGRSCKKLIFQLVKFQSKTLTRGENQKKVIGGMFSRHRADIPPWYPMYIYATSMADIDVRHMSAKHPHPKHHFFFGFRPMVHLLRGMKRNFEKYR